MDQEQLELQTGHHGGRMTCVRLHGARCEIDGLGPVDRAATRPAPPLHDAEAVTARGEVAEGICGDGRVDKAPGFYPGGLQVRVLLTALAKGGSMGA